MVKKITAVKARQNLGQIMNEVSLLGDDYMIERAGKPLAVIISIDKYQSVQAKREEALRRLNQIWDKMGDTDPDTLEQLVNEAVRKGRKKA
ncbi:MAG: type II toxin-antitoxin system Phd/YefM family antitoxin [Dehalobacter sp. 4CP]|nr:type II toxin-antitoxin system Phd/YefM family antitoxin [Dehalobacter sp. 4CP]